MKITIITVCYNSEKTIEDTIKSVLSQSHENFEYIIIDGQSKDHTLDIINRYTNDKRIRLISEKDKGLYDAMNKGIINSSGDIIGIINSDDVVYDNNIFQTVIDNFDDNTDIVYADVLYCDEKLENTVRNYISGENKADFWCPAHPSMYIRKEVYEKIGLYNLDYKVVADYDFMVRCNAAGMNFKYVKQYFVKMRYGGLSNGIKGYIIDFIEVYKTLKNNKIKLPLTKTVIRSIQTIIQIIRK